jgi:hypothetical protein
MDHDAAMQFLSSPLEMLGGGVEPCDIVEADESATS